MFVNLQRWPALSAWVFLRNKGASFGKLRFPLTRFKFLGGAGCKGMEIAAQFTGDFAYKFAYSFYYNSVVVAIDIGVIIPTLIATGV
jgi:hypothetical protein